MEVLWPIVGVSIAELALHLAMRVWLGEDGYDKLHLWLKEALGVGLILLAAGLYDRQYHPAGSELLTVIALMFVGAGGLLGISHLVRWGKQQHSQGAAETLEDLRR